MSALTSERDRIVSEFHTLEARQEALESDRAVIAQEIKAAAGDAKALSLYKIKAEQMAEAKRMIDRQIAQTRTRLTEIEKVLAMQLQSGMT